MTKICFDGKDDLFVVNLDIKSIVISVYQRHVMGKRFMFYPIQTTKAYWLSNVIYQ